MSFQVSTFFLRLFSVPEDTSSFKAKYPNMIVKFNHSLLITLVFPLVKVKLASPLSLVQQSKEKLKRKLSVCKGSIRKDSCDRNKMVPKVTATVGPSHVSAQSCSTLCGPLDCRPPGSSVHGIFQARILEQVAISYSR